MWTGHSAFLNGSDAEAKLDDYIDLSIKIRNFQLSRSCTHPETRAHFLKLHFSLANQIISLIPQIQFPLVSRLRLPLVVQVRRVDSTRRCKIEQYI